MTTKRILITIGILFLGGLGCSSSPNPAKDSGADAPTTKDSGADAPKDTTGDTATDATATETGGDAADTGATDIKGDAIVLTPLQARGKYLVNNVAACSDCHTPQGAQGPDLTKFLAGNPSFIVLPNGDKLPTRNLTNDETGLKNRTDAEIKAMFMDGKRPAATGTEALNPVMPYYVFHNMTSEDGDAIVAYLRTVPGVANTIPKRSASFDVPGPANYLDPTKIPAPADTFPEKDSALRGRYLATKAGVCIECHTPHQMAADVLNPAKFFQGGEDFSALFATTLMIKPVSKNLTSDNVTGLGTWSASDIVRVLKEGKAKDGSGICPPMPVGPMGAFGGLKDDDAADIANYIKSLPPIVNMVPDMCVFPPPPRPDAGTDASAEAGAEGGGDAMSSADTTGN
jgi:mono/diheme cytochrome c family protein